MTRSDEARLHEISFCGDVKSWADALFAAHPEWPFSKAAIEEFGRGTNQRHDLRIFRKGSQTPVLTGEVKLPGTPEGRSPYDPILMQDAFSKADNIQAPYFFTWNVKTFVLFDRSRWNVPMIQRRVRDWPLEMEDVNTPADCRRPDVQAHIRDQLLPKIFQELAAIVEGLVSEWGIPPDDIFIRSLESHLDWPVLGTRDHLISACRQDRGFAARLQGWMSEEMNWTFDPEDAENWKSALERAARTLCYVFCNRAIFYEAIRAKYPDNLHRLTMPRPGRRVHAGIYDYFRARFHQAVLETGDYEPIFYPQVNDWSGALVFASDMACQGWRGLFANLGEYNFREIPYDIIGGIFQKLIAPEERQKFGQFFTNEDIVDIINAFCIRRAGDVMLDPACGSGSFLVRAYHRKAWLSQQKAGGRRHQDRQKSHQELLREIYGCDIALFAAHLATLNLAARHIEDEENYPYIARSNFFEVPGRREAFCVVPGLNLPSGGKDKSPVPLPDFDAVVGNPPYVRQEHILRRSELKRGKGETKESFDARLRNTKEHFQELCKELWPGMKLSGRSDLHCYFWPVASKLLKNDGYFGFLTSSSWLDVEYGFALQGWILKNFKLLAIMESMDEPWFQDARVKTAIAILQRCSDEKTRMANSVKFVRLLKPVKDILGKRPLGDEAARQNAVEALRQIILQTAARHSDEQLRIIPVPQAQLWEEGVKAGALLGEGGVDETGEDNEEKDDPPVVKEVAAMYQIGQDYVAGKWGRFLRAPDLYFNLLRDYDKRFVKLGEIARVKRGITSGCDAFFMPRDVTDEIKAKLADGLPWNDVGVMTPCKRAEIEDGTVRIVRAGDNTLHPVETRYLRPEVHSLMEVDRPVIRAKDLDRVVLWVNEPRANLTRTYAGKYIRWGAKQTFVSKKSKAVPVPQRSTCAARPVWYDLTTVTAGTVFWPMAQKYRHIAPANPDSLVCNHNLFHIATSQLSEDEAVALTASLNSTVVALFKHFYGRYAGAEGTLKTEVVDTILLEIPDPRGVSPKLAERMRAALDKISRRKVTHLVDNAILQCHSEQQMREILRAPPELPRELLQEDRRELDECILELLGVSAKEARRKLLDELYLETARYYRYQRTQDIQAMANRAGNNNGRRLGPADLAGSIWDSLAVDDKGPSIGEWIKSQFHGLQTVDIPDGKPKPLGAEDMFHPADVMFESGGGFRQVSYGSAEQAALAAELAKLEIRGRVDVPNSSGDCAKCAEQIKNRLNKAQERFAELAAARTGTHALQEKTADLLLHWFIHGKDVKGL
ncbi:MAG: SAM-dependent DNA methyltransferase [Verrucomicrobia bacterium]|nr:SAM-dependent DNA methyltransferase [Verrucomicrobiota bacterium]